MASTKNTNKGFSLAKGPAGIVGLVLLAFGVTALLFGSHSFTTHAIHGTVDGERWLGFEVNGWSALLCAGAGAALVFAAPLHWGAKTVSLIVAIVLGEAALLAFADGHDAMGIFAAGHLTELGWAIAAGVLLVVALLPRVGAGAKDDRRDAETRGARQRERDLDRRLAHEPAQRVPVEDRVPRDEAGARRPVRR